MREAVSDVLDLRMREADGFNRMIVVSLGAHAALLALIVLTPASWRTTSPKAQATPMMISLGGAPGPSNTGMTQVSSRPVQAIAPPDAKPTVETPPAAKAPEMVAPDAIKPKPREPNKVEKPIDKSANRKPTAGAVVTPGTARVETGAQPRFGEFSGLSTSGGGGTGAQLDVKDFCCPEYIQTMIQKIHANWRPNQGAQGLVVVKFTIRRDGMLTNVEVERPSGNSVLDLESRRAILYTERLPPLPNQFTEPYLTVHLTFGYQR